MAGYTGKEFIQIRILNSIESGERIQQNPELLYVMEGQLDIKVGDYQTHLQREGFYVVNGNKKCVITGSENILFARITISSQLVSSLSQSASVLFWCDSNREDNMHYDTLRRLLRKLMNRYLTVREKGEDFGYFSLCYQLLDELTANFLLRLTDKDDIGEQTNYEERIVQINNYINMNYNRPISSKDLSERLFLSQGYLSRFFKKHYGMSFAEHLQSVRLSHAVDDLIYTGAPITRIAYDNGFANVSAFNKAFKDVYGDTPSAMRKKLKENSANSVKTEQEQQITDQLTNFLKTNGADVEETADTKKIQDACSVSHSTKMNPIWGETINIGSAAFLLRSEIREQILWLADKLDIRHVRFWNIFSQPMLIDLSGRYESYNFSQLDSILDFLTQNNLKPHIELGMKPRRLYRTLQSAIIEETISDTTDIAVFEHFVDTLMQHLLRRYRRSELNTWRIEFWFNEKKWGDSEEEEKFYQRFNILYRTVKQYAGDMLVGGCGLRPDFIDIDTVGLRFLQKWREQPCQPDYISMLVYVYQRGEIDEDRYSKRSTDEDHVAHSIAKIKSIMNQADMRDYKLFVTEWNLTISDRNVINDTCFKGAYILKNVIDNFDKVDLMSYFIASDLSAEYYDSDGPFFGGCGLISKDGILKPAGYAFRFLKWLYPYYIGKGKNYLLTTDQYHSYGLVCHNQKTLNYNYYLSTEDKIEKNCIWKYFEDRDSLEMRLSLTDVANGQYQIKTYRINESIGSPIKIWEEMDYEVELSRNDIYYLNRECGPQLTIQTAEVNNHILPLVIQLDSNEIRFIRIRKIK